MNHKNNLLSKIGDYTKKAALYLSIPFITAFYGCQKDDIKPEVQDSNATLYLTTKVLEGESLENVSGYTDNTVSFHDALDNSYEVGDYLIGGISDNTPYGLNPRKIESFTAGRHIVNTSNATLEDVVQNGTIMYNRQFSYDDILAKNVGDFPGETKLSPSSRGFDLHFERSIYGADGNYSTTNDQIVLTGDLNFDISSNSEIRLNRDDKYVRFGLNANGNFSLSLDSKVALSYEKEFEIWHTYFNYIVITTPVPVVIIPKLSVNMGFEGEVSGNVTTGMNEEFSSSSTLIYNGDWTTSKTTSTDFSFTPPTLSLDETLKAYINTKLDLLFYGMTGPYGSVEAYTKLDANLTENPWWTFSAGLEGKIGYETEILSRNIFSVEKNLFDIQRELANAGGPFIDNPDDPHNPELDSVIIQPGPEGKDAWIRLTRWPDGTETYAGNGNDSILEVYLQQGSSIHQYNSLIQFSLNEIPENADISSAKLDIYGYSGSNCSSCLPVFSFHKLTQSWNENIVTWENKPNSESVTEAEFPNYGTFWNSVDVTSLVKDWYDGEPNYGLEIELNTNESQGIFYSSDNLESDKRPKLVVYYEK